MASKKIVVDKDGNKVAAGSEHSAFIFNEGDERLDKFRKAVAARKAIAAGKPAPEPLTTDEETSTERVSRPGSPKK